MLEFQPVHLVRCVFCKSYTDHTLVDCGRYLKAMGAPGAGMEVERVVAYQLVEGLVGVRLRKTKKRLEAARASGSPGAPWVIEMVRVLTVCIAREERKLRALKEFDYYALFPEEQPPAPPADGDAALLRSQTWERLALLLLRKLRVMIKILQRQAGSRLCRLRSLLCPRGGGRR